MTAPPPLHRRVRAVAVAVAALLAACAQDAPPRSPEVVAEIAGEPVLYAEFEAYVEDALGEPGSSLGSDVLSGLFDQFLEERLLLRLALDHGVMTPEAAAGRFARRRAVDRLLASGPEAAWQPDEEAVATWYDTHRDRFRRPQRVRLRQLLVHDRATAERALAEIRGGADFAAVARRVSQAPDSLGAADFQGELAREDVPPAFADVIFDLEPGEVSEVVEAEYGFHLFQVTDRLPAEVLPLDAVRVDVERELRQQRADRRLAELAAEARRRYDVAVWAKNLPFDYRGTYLREGS